MNAPLAPPGYTPFLNRPVSVDPAVNPMYYVKDQFVGLDGRMIEPEQLTQTHAPLHIPVCYRLLWSDPELLDDTFEQDDCGDPGPNPCDPEGDGNPIVCDWIRQPNKESYSAGPRFHPTFGNLIMFYTPPPGYPNPGPRTPSSAPFEPPAIYSYFDFSLSGLSGDAAFFGGFSVLIYAASTSFFLPPTLLYTGNLLTNNPFVFCRKNVTFGWINSCTGQTFSSNRDFGENLEGSEPICPTDYPPYGTGCVPSGADPCNRGGGTSDGSPPRPGC